jgi:hypothetical protein
MIIDVASDLSSMTVLAERAEQENILGSRHGSEAPLPVWTCENPVLLTDTARIAALEPGLRDALFALYESYPRVVRYDGVQVTWAPHLYPKVWTANIDTVFFARWLKPALVGVSTIAEVGTGSGFLTKFALRHGQIDRAVASDINLQALRCASDAIAELEHSTNVSLVNPQANDPTLGFEGAFDVLMCNPPYIPRPGERNDNPFEGLDLIAKLATQGEHLLSDSGVMLINISTLAGDEPLQWLLDCGWKIDTLASMDVPLKVNAVTSGVTPESRAWLEYLADRGIRQEAPHRGYALWHTLRFLACRRR